MHEALEGRPAHAVDAVTDPDPYPYYQQLREERPLYFDGGLKLWVNSSQAVIHEALQNPALCVRPPAAPVPSALQGTAAGNVFAQLVRMTDGGFHAALKPAVVVAARRWSLADVARVSEAAACRQPHLGVNALMSRLPVQVMASLLAVPDQEMEATCHQVQQFVHGIVPGASQTAVALASEAAHALMAQGRALGLEPVQAANRIGFMQQSLDATAGLIGHTALMLSQHPQLADAADSSPDAMRAFVAEVERHQAPIQNTRRFAVAFTTLAGQAIQAGQGVLLVLASGNRDAAFNPRADRFEPGRTGSRSMGFGSGVHACPGTLIAIEIVAIYVRWIRAKGRFDLYFARQTGFRPLGNARIPVFAE